MTGFPGNAQPAYVPCPSRVLIDVYNDALENYIIMRHFEWPRKLV